MCRPGTEHGSADTSGELVHEQLDLSRAAGPPGKPHHQLPEQAAQMQAPHQQTLGAQQPSQQPSHQPGSAARQGGPEHSTPSPAQAAAARGPALGAGPADAALGPEEGQPLRSIVVGREQAVQELKPEGLEGTSQGCAADDPGAEVRSLGVLSGSLE